MLPDSLARMCDVREATASPALYDWWLKCKDHLHTFSPPSSRQDWYEAAFTVANWAFFGGEDSRAALLDLLQAGVLADDYCAELSSVSLAQLGANAEPALQLLGRDDYLGIWTAARLAWLGLRNMDERLVDSAIEFFKRRLSEAPDATLRWELFYSLQLKRHIGGEEPDWSVLGMITAFMPEDLQARAIGDMSRLRRWISITSSKPHARAGLSVVPYLA